MHLLIRAVSLAGQPLTQAISAYFDERGGTIGRSDTNTLALPDPERRISRLQAEVSRSPDGWRILNVGNANPIWHNNRPVPPGEGVLLDEGDELQVGTYALQVTYSKNDATARTITKGRAAVDSRTVIVGSGQEPRTDPGLMLPALHAGLDATPAAVTAPLAPQPTPQPASPAPALAQATAASPFGDLLGDWSKPAAAAIPTPSAVHGGAAGPAASSSPFGDLLGFGSPAVGAIGLASAPASTPPAAATRLPDDFDPFADLSSAPTPASRSATLPTSWDLPKAAPKATSASPFDLMPGESALPGDLDLMGVVAPAGAQSLDQMFGLQSGTSSGPLAAFLKSTEPAAPAEAPVGAPSHMDPLALLGSREAIQAEPASLASSDHRPIADDVPELQAAMVLPEVRPSAVVHPVPTEPDTAVDAPVIAKASPFADLGLGTPARVSLMDDLDLSPPTIPSVHVAAPRPASLLPDEPLIDLTVPLSTTPLVEPSPLVTEVPAQPAPALAGDTQALWAAFCEGSGVKFAPPQGLNPDLMRVIGQLLHHAVDGSLKLVAARAATKQEMRAEVTVIQARRNNPLKFSPDTESAMAQLLQPPMRGFMTGPEAVADAMDDLLGHTIGTMVGMRAALDGVLARFEPVQLETKLVGRSMIDSLLPMNRRAKLWELYLQHYEGVRSEAQDDFHNLFGRAFLQAYEEQLDRLDAERRQAGDAKPGKPGTPA